MKNRNPAQLVTLYFGDSHQKFVVHKDFVCHYSPVLKAAFNSDFLEGQTQTYRFEETTEGALRLFVHWIYTQDLDIARQDNSRKSNLEDDKNLPKITTREEGQVMVELWILAEKLLVPSLQNAVVLGLEERRKNTHMIHSQCCTYVWEHTSKDSPLRQLFLHQLAGGYTAAHFRRWINTGKFVPQEMVLELLALFAGNIRDEEKGNLRVAMNMEKVMVAED